MAFERTLLERIAKPEDHVSSLESDPRKVSESVQTHLINMMNTRQGSSISVPDYGLPDFNDLKHRYPDALNELRRAIKLCIEKYEPRLTRIKVKYVPDEDNPIQLRFEINALLNVNGKNSSVWYETTLDSAGRANVRG
jgi:type VI secretion system protein